MKTPSQRAEEVWESLTSGNLTNPRNVEANANLGRAIIQSAIEEANAAGYNELAKRVVTYASKPHRYDDDGICDKCGHNYTKPAQPCQPAHASECRTNTAYSGVCIRGTKACNVIHPEANTTKTAHASEQGQEKWTVDKLSSLYEHHSLFNFFERLLPVLNATLQPRDCGEDTKRLDTKRLDWLDTPIGQQWVQPELTEGASNVREAIDAAMEAHRIKAEDTPA